MNKFKIIPLAVILTLIAFKSYSNEPDEVPLLKTITLKVKGMKNTKGIIRAFLFNSKSSYLKEEILEETQSINSSKEVILNFKNMPKGTYSIFVYHDENNDNKMDENWLGIPTEDYGFSNNARGTMGPPDFEESKFEFDGQSIVLSIIIK